MGSPKALIPLGGRTMLAWVVDELAPAFDEVLVSVAREGDLPAAAGGAHGTTVIADRHPGAGPLAGLEAGLAAAVHEAVFVVACDMPLVTRSLGRLLVEAVSGRDAAVPLVGRRPQPACAVYAKAVAPVVTRALETKRLRFSDLLDEIDVRFLEDADFARAGVGKEAFWSVNTPADLARVSALVSSAGEAPGGVPA